MRLDNLSSTVADGNILLALSIAMVAGVLSFVSPCILPLVPGYLAYIGGVTTSDTRRNRSRVVLGVLLFISGFSLVYVGFTLAFSVAGLYLIPWIGLITRIAGVVVIAMGFVFIGRLSFLQRIVKPAWTARTGLLGAPLLGVIFALGWAPCSGPTLSVVLSLSLGSGSATRGILLGVAYCFGVGVPFLLVALGLNWISGAISWTKRHTRLINILGGIALMIIGLLMVLGVWQAWVSGLGSFLPGWVSPI